MPPAGVTDTPVKDAAASEIKPDPDYEFRRKALDLVEDWQKHDSDSQEDKKHREETILPKIKELVIHNLNHNAEIEACDILMEIERIDLLKEMAQKLEHLDYERICLYILSCAPFIPDPENITLIDMARDLYMHFGKNIEALRCAMRTNNTSAIEKIFGSTTDGAIKMQMSLMLGRQQIFLEVEDQLLSQLNANFYLNKHFLAFARELDLMTPKTPDEVYKTYLEPNRPFATQQVKNMTLQNLASSFVNGFVNAGFGTDAFFKDEKSTSDWLAKHKEWAAFSTAATFGLIHHWNVDSLNNFEIHTQSKDIYVKAGALFATGIVFSGVQDPEVDPAFAILQDFLFNEHLPLRVASIFGLGLAYANSKRQTVIDQEESVVQSLRKVIADDQILANQAEVKGLAALSLGFILIGSGRENSETVCELLTYLMSGVDLNDVNMRLVALGIGLIFLGRQNECDETILEPLRALSDPFGKIASTLVDVCAYAGTGNVLKVQEMLHICSEHYEKEAQKEESKTKVPSGAPLPDITAPAASVPTNSANGDAEEGEAATSTKSQTKSEEAPECLSQAVAVLGIALVAMGEDIGSQMCLRQFGHLYRYGEPVIRRAVPLALALLSPSNPQLTVIETLSKYSHDSDAETARNAIFALGLVGAGTNNARVLAMLRQLASYHSRDQKTMILLRIAQGLIHLGKGTMTLNPFHSDRQLICPTVVGALLCTCLAFIDSEQTVLNGRQHYLLFSLVAAIQPRMLITVVQDTKDENELVQKSVQVRVGQAVDVVAQAGKPRAITGFQTHSTPVLLGYGERAELADDDYIPLTPVLEGIVILKKKETEEEKKIKKEEMDKIFTILLATTTIISIYEVVSNENAQLKEEGDEIKTPNNDKDSFSQFDDIGNEEEPAYKYKEEAQEVGEKEEDELRIREPTREKPKGGTFKPPINMPPVKFSFCVSCGYRQAYEQFAQILREKYPGIEVVGENYAPGLARGLAAQLLGFAKIALIICIIMGRDPFPSLGLQTPRFFQWMANNKMSASIMIFLFSNAIEGMLQSTGAFEIYLENERIWSKLESGRVPSPPELFEAIDSQITLRGPSKFSGSSFGIDDSN